MAVIQAGGTIAFAFMVVGMAAAVFGAALETTLSSGYTIAQYFGWSWGKFRRPAKAARFHLVMLVGLIIAVLVLMTGVDPVAVTEFSVVFSAIALPLTYIPILIVSNDKEYMGKYRNGPVTNALSLVFMVVILVAAIAAIPLMIISGAGQ